MNIRPIRIALLPIAALCFIGTALAAPQITPLGEADKRGEIVYSVKCDNGSKKIMQCVRDDQHCGYAGDAPLATLVAEACGGAPAAAIPPAADDATPFETSPIAP